MTAPDVLAPALEPRNRLFIDGSFADAADGATLDAVSPRDGAVLARVAAAGEQDVNRAVAAARRAFSSGRWAGASPRHRKRVLLQLAELIRENSEELALLETLDMGKPIGEARRVDVPSAAAVIQWYAEAIDKTPCPLGTARTRTRQGTRNTTMRKQSNLTGTSGGRPLLAISVRRRGSAGPWSAAVLRGRSSNERPAHRFSGGGGPAGDDAARRSRSTPRHTTARPWSPFRRTGPPSAAYLSPGISPPPRT
jgi:Aldehyde dehydrogenase family